MGTLLMFSPVSSDTMNLGHGSLQNPVTSADPPPWENGRLHDWDRVQKSNVPRAVQRNDDSKKMKSRYLERPATEQFDDLPLKVIQIAVPGRKDDSPSFLAKP